SCACLSIDASCSRRHRLTIARRRSIELSSLDVRLGYHHPQGDTGSHKSAGRDPPISLASATPVPFQQGQVPSRAKAPWIIASRTWLKCSHEARFGLKLTPERRAGPTLRVVDMYLRHDSHRDRNIGEPQGTS